MKKSLTLTFFNLILLLAILAFVTIRLAPPEESASRASIADSFQQADEPPTTDEFVHLIAQKKSHLDKIDTSSDFKTLITKLSASSPTAQAHLIHLGVRMAQKRNAKMKVLMREDPSQAMTLALRLDEWLALPEEIRTHVETPFANTAEFQILPHCSDHDEDQHNQNYRRTYQGMPTFTYGERSAITSKAITSSSGIQIDDNLLLDDSPVKSLDPREIGAARQLFKESPRGIKIDPITGNPASPEIVAVIGGRLHGFESAKTLHQTIHSLEAAESSPSPRSMVYAMNSINGISPYSPSEVINIAATEASTWTETAKKVLFIRVHFTDKIMTPFTQSELLTKLSHSSDLIDEMSYGKTQLLNPDVTPSSLNLAHSSATYLAMGNPSSSILTDAKSLAAAAGYTLNDYDIIGVSFPYVSELGYSGLASIGGSSHWLNGAVSTGTIIHELGHNYGLRHASFWDTTNGSVMGIGNHNEYGDIFDMMGWSGSYADGHFSAYGKSRLNWIPDSRIISSTSTTGTYRIYRADHPDVTSNLPLALKLQKGDSEELWISYRKNFTSNPYLSNGLYIQWNHTDSSQPNEARLLDMTPETSTKTDSALALNKTFIDPTSNLHITPVATGGTTPNEWIDVFIGVLGNTPPVVNISIPDVSARTEFSITGSFTDPDGDAMTYHWNFGDGSPSVTGANPSHTYMAGGAYTLTASALDHRGGVGKFSILVTVSDPLASWTDRSPGNSDNFDAAAYGNGRLVVGGRNLYTSVDLTQWWTATNIKTSSYFKDITFINDNFYACGYHYISGWYGMVYSSSDGRNWEIENTGTHGTLYAITQSNSITIAVGDGGLIKRKSETWDTITPPGTSKLYDVAANGNTFVAVGSSGTILTSQDQGLTWIDTSPSSAYNTIYSVHYSDGKFHIQGYKRIYSSSDGMTWAQHDSPIESYTMQSITAGLGLLVSTGLDTGQSPNTDILFISENGNDYGKLSLSDTPDVNVITYGNSTFFTAGDSGSIRQSAPLVSSNTAPSIVISGPSTTTTQTNVTFTASASDENGDSLRIIWDFGSSARIPDSSTAVYRFSSAGTYDVTAYAVDGNGGVSSHTISIVVSSPYTSWSSVSSGTTSDLHAIESINSHTLIAGGSNTCLISSNAGDSWAPATSIPNNITIYGFCNDGTTSHATGSHYNGILEGAILTSTDNLTWSLLTIPSGLPSLRAITKDSNGVIVAVGNSGTIIRSTNGSTWTTPASGTAEDLKAITVSSSDVFVASGNGSVVLRSTDGVNWAPPSSIPSTGNWYETAFSINDEVYVGGVYSGFRKSDDNADIWTSSSPSFISAYLKDMSYGSGTFLAVGSDSVDSVNYDAYWKSTNGSDWSEITVGSSYHSWKACSYSGRRFYTVGRGGAIFRSALLPPVGYSEWSAFYMPSGGSASLPLSDYEGDGKLNFLEYALGSDPTMVIEINNPDITTENGIVTIKIIKPPHTHNVRYTVEYSEDLSTNSWTSLKVIEDYNTPIIYQAHISQQASNKSLFYRVKITELTP